MTTQHVKREKVPNASGDVLDEQIMLKADLNRRNVSCKQLAEKLTAMGIPDTEANINCKISRGGFTAVFLVQCLTAVGCQTLRINDQ